MSYRSSARILGALGLAACALLGSVPSRAASIPAWLDQAITTFNTNNPTTPIEFIAIKDQYAWYRLPKGGGIDAADIRTKVYGIAQSSGYSTMSPEELVTTARPPVPSGAATQKKCWSRSFTMTVTTGQERLLTSLICEDTADWKMAFRVIQ
ncbi:MAG TPA: hypothetical protein VFV75_06175 [Candidatus Polarisedimenticolaceae bacterium]|nr:hypothetical protein [Candidatus Polarisedimenticolaceae bacterium]